MEKWVFFSKAFICICHVLQKQIGRHDARGKGRDPWLCYQSEWIGFFLLLSSFTRAKDASVNWGASTFQAHFISPHNGTIAKGTSFEIGIHCNGLGRICLNWCQTRAQLKAEWTWCMIFFIVLNLSLLPNVSTKNVFMILIAISSSFMVKNIHKKLFEFITSKRPMVDSRQFLFSTGRVHWLNDPFWAHHATINRSNKLRRNPIISQHTYPFIMKLSVFDLAQTKVLDQLKHPQDDANEIVHALIWNAKCFL